MEYDRRSNLPGDRPGGVPLVGGLRVTPAKRPWNEPVLTSEGSLIAVGTGQSTANRVYSGGARWISRIRIWTRP
jgi:hypothetical protein